MGDWSSEGVVMVTSDHDEVENDQKRLSVTEYYTNRTSMV